MKRVVVFVLLLCSWMSVLSQDWAKVPTQSGADVRLKVGDRVPFSELHNMINYPSKTLKLSDHKPKLIILDFWATTCGPCIKFWPTALQLQQEFGKDLMIIPVNRYERVNLVKSFLEKRKKVTGVNMNLPMTCRDSTLWKNFPQSDLPSYVWISADGVIGSVTHTRDVNSMNIKRWMTSGSFPMEQMSDKMWYTVQPNAPIFVNGNGGQRPNEAFIWTSSLTKSYDDIGADQIINIDSVFGYQILLTGASIKSLYGQAYNNRLREWDHFDFLPHSRMELIARDTTKYYWKDGSSGNTYNYQLISGRPVSRKELLTMMQRDLDRYFGIDVKWEKRRKKCLVFTMFDSSLATKRKILSPEMELRKDRIIMDSVDLKTITVCMEMASKYRFQRYPIVDETAYRGVITGIREEGDPMNLVDFNKALAKCGLRLKYEMREVDVLVLREPEFVK